MSSLLRGLLSLYSWRYPRALAYMLQSSEYQPGPYVRWYWRTGDFSKVIYRRSLDYTGAAKMLLIALEAGMAAQLLAGIAVLSLRQDGWWQIGLALIISYPIVWGHLALIPLLAGRWFIILPKEWLLTRRAEVIFRRHPGIKLAVAGSYGKTSMKELLLTVLSEGKKVAATPANKNVAISHARFARTLQGDEAVVIIEYDEAGPGDVARFARTTHPTHAVITGIAPAHLDRYKTVERAAKDIFSLQKFVEPAKLYVNAESPLAEVFLAKHFDWQPYSQKSVLGWKISDIAVSLDGVRFKMTKGDKVLELHSGLIGRHQVGPLALTAALADLLGLSQAHIIAGITKTKPFEHRLQAYQLGGAWILDDTYNGNIEGVRAGTRLLQELPAQRKIYITPGLVDQGPKTQQIHEEMGRLIAEAKPDLVILMRNSAAPAIQRGLHTAGYRKELRIEDDPLDFYTHLQAFVAAGDLVLMQNDWTDNYA